MSESAFDYRAYRPLTPPRLRPPARSVPQLAWSQPVVTFHQPRPDELDELLGTIHRAAGDLGKCGWRLTGIVWRRALEWLDTRILHNLFASWALASFGWGAFIAYPIIQYFTR